MIRLSLGLIIGCALLALAPTTEARVATSCESLSSLKLADTAIKSATSLPAGRFTPPGSQPVTVPALCRVVATTLPAVNFEVWLPAEWNGKFQGVGNGGMAGSISYSAMAAAVARGYAVVSTDTGHVTAGSFDAKWALGRPDLVADFGHRGLHVATMNGKAIAREFYARAASHAYYVGCSKGGQQGLMEAQRYPDDYDGLIAGDPANNWTRFYAGGHLWYSLATLKDPESYIPAAKVALLTNAVNAACDASDGVADGVLEDPRTCHFNPAALTCKTSDDPATCFTPKQVKAIQDIWAGARNGKGELIYPGLAPGGESGSGGWASWTTGTAPFTGTHWVAADGFFKYMVFQNPNWDFRTFDYDRDMPIALAKVGPVLDATDPDLRPLARRGGKLLVYHGWSDPDISPLNSIAYYESVVATMGKGQSRETALENTQEFFRLFMVPGMQHCSGGPGATNFDMVTTLENWVEHGAAPKQVTATRVVNGASVRTRPLCPYPQIARWTGSGSTDEASSFACVRDPDPAGAAAAKAR